MNLPFFIIFGLTLIYPVYPLTGGNIANKYFLEKQKFIFEIVHHIQEPLQNEEWINMGRTLVMDKTQYIEFNDLMHKFYLKAQSKNLLPLNANFYVADRSHSEQLRGLYLFLYNAQDFETLIQNICWARSNVNPQMFIFALTQTLINREDLKELNFPKIYEIWPQHFFVEKSIRKLQNFNYAKWTKVETLYCLHNSLNATNESTCKPWQWWCSEQKLFNIYKEKERMILPTRVYGNFRNSSKWFEALLEVSLYYLPVDFSRDSAMNRDIRERENSYLLEDKDWNSYWYYINMGFWQNQEQSNAYTKDLRDWWFWNLQQIVTRHKMNSNLGKEKSNYTPYLLDFKGIKYQTLDYKQSSVIWNFLMDLTQKTNTALSEQTYEYQLKPKMRLNLNNPDDLEIFLSDNFNVEKILNILMSFGHSQKFPTVLQNYETMLRSAEFYEFAEIIVSLYQSLKANFEPYKLQDLKGDGLTINNVEITELKTYFEIMDTDVTNVLRSSNIYFEGKLLWFKALLARQQNLQHQPFTLWFNVTSNKSQAVIVRTFLARECKPQAAMCSEDTDYLQLDTFVSNLAAGYNVIERSSKDFYGYMSASLTYTELYHFVRLALNEEYQFPLNISTGNCRFPHHLLLPRGQEVEGLPVKFVFVITPYSYHFHKAYNMDCDFSSGILKFDNLPHGFPFGRDISESVFMQSNIFVKKTKIDHDANVKLK